MEKIRAFWWYEKNFGDALNPFLLERLSGKKVIFCNQHRPYYKEEFRRFFKCLRNREWYDFRRLSWPVLDKPVVLSIGSMLKYSKPNYNVWGTGFLRNDQNFIGGNIIAVRGPYTAQCLVDLGYPKCDVYGDPALLLPLVYKPLSKPKVGSCLIPHVVDYISFMNKYKGIKILNLETYDCASIIDDIVSSSFVLSSSLHGVIVSHAYGIPALWVKGKRTGTDGIKFKDYFASVGLDVYEGDFQIDSLINLTFGQIPVEIKSLMLPEPNKIKEVQHNLLKVAPFKTVVDGY